MATPINRFPRKKRLQGKDLDQIIDRLNRTGEVYASGRNVRVSRGPLGTHINFIDVGRGAAGGEMFIAEVTSSDTGGGYYDCTLQKFDSSDWKTDSDAFENTSSDVEVLNIVEVGSSIHNLDAGDKIACWQIVDDEDNTRYIGVEVFGRHDFGEW